MSNTAKTPKASDTAPSVVATTGGSGWSWSFRYEGAATGVQTALLAHANAVPADAGKQFSVAASLITEEAANVKGDVLVTARGDSGFEGCNERTFYVEIVAR